MSVVAGWWASFIVHCLGSAVRVMALLVRRFIARSAC